MFATTVVGISGRRGVSSIRDRANVIDKQVEMKGVSGSGSSGIEMSATCVELK